MVFPEARDTGGEIANRCSAELVVIVDQEYIEEAAIAVLVAQPPT